MNNKSDHLAKLSNRVPTVYTPRFSSLAARLRPLKDSAIPCKDKNMMDYTKNEAGQLPIKSRLPWSSRSWRRKG